MGDVCWSIGEETSQDVETDMEMVCHFQVEHEKHFYCRLSRHQVTGIWLLFKSFQSALGEGSEMEMGVNMGMWILIICVQEEEEGDEG